MDNVLEDVRADKVDLQTRSKVYHYHSKGQVLVEYGRNFVRLSYWTDDGRYITDSFRQENVVSIATKTNA
jgi:hypothetical protein